MRGKSSSSFRIGVDLMGSDAAPGTLLKAMVVLSSTLPKNIRLVLLGTSRLFIENPLPKNIEAISTKEVISMEDDPLTAVRRKKKSSLLIGIDLLKKRKLHALVTAGNTGALLASAKLFLSMLPSIARPALLALLPTKEKEIAVLDVGANLSCKAEHLYQFALMGIAYQKTRGVSRPLVGLLNIGSEKQKGTPELRKAYQKLQELNKGSRSFKPFAGNVEGRDVFKGKIDVLITDGFVGNVFLKTVEGVGAFLLEELEKSTSEQCPPHLKNSLAAMRYRLNYEQYPGAILCGVDGVVIKCHGDGSPEALTRSVEAAARLLNHSFLDQIKSEL